MDGALGDVRAIDAVRSAAESGAGTVEAGGVAESAFALVAEEEADDDSFEGASQQPQLMMKTTTEAAIDAAGSQASPQSSSRRRLLLAALGGALLAETAGQTAEHTLMSEPKRLQLTQKRRLQLARPLLICFSPPHSYFKLGDEETSPLADLHYSLTCQLSTRAEPFCHHRHHRHHRSCYCNFPNHLQLIIPHT